MTETQIQTDIVKYVFDFSPYFLSTDTISSISVLSTPSGLVELTAKRSTSGQAQTIVIDAASATVSTSYILACQGTSSSGIRQTLYKTIYVIADETGALPITASLGYNAIYSVILAQSGTAAPTATVYTNTLVGTPAWTRTGVGTYVATLTGAFLANKTKVSCHIVPLQSGNESKAAGVRLTDNTVQITVRDFADNLVDAFTTLYLDIQTYT